MFDSYSPSSFGLLENETISQDNSISLKELMDDDGLMYKIRHQNRSIIKSLENSIDDLLELSFAGVMTKFNTLGFRILIMGSGSILSAAISSPMLGSIARVILAADGTNFLSIGRFCQFAEVCIEYNGLMFLKQVPFVHEFIKYINEPNCLSMFRQILSKNETASRAAENGMFSYILNSRSPELIALAIDSVAFHDFFFEQNSIETIISSNDFELIHLLVHEDFKDNSWINIEALVQSAIHVITSSSNSVNTYFAIEFLTKILFYSSFNSPKEIVSILSGAFQVSTSSFILASIFDFFKHAIEIPDYQEIVINYFFPCVINSITNNTNITRYAYSCQYMRAVRKSAKENPSLEEAIGKDSDFIYICNTIVFNKDTILSKSYGNPIIENNIAFRSK